MPRDEPDAVADLERAVEEFPAWTADGLAAVYLLGARRTVHVPGYTVIPLVRERVRADAAQAEDLRTQTEDPCQAVLYRSDGDPLGLLRLGVRVPAGRVADVDEEELDAIASAAGPYLDDGRADRVDAVLLVADADHLRIPPSAFFEDVSSRWTGRRRRPSRQAERPHAARPPAVPTTPTGGFPGRPHRIRPVGPPRRRVEAVEPVVELEDEVEAVGSDEPAAAPGPASKLLAHVDAKRLEIGGKLAVRMLRMQGFRVLEDVYHGRTKYVAAAERDTGQPRRVVVRALDRLGRRDLDQLRLDARALAADLVLAIVPDAPDAMTRRAAGTRVRLVRPEDVPDLSL